MSAPARFEVQHPRAVAPSAHRDWLRALELTARLADVPHRTLPTVIDEWAARQGAAPALLSGRESFDYATLADRSNRYSRWALAEGLLPGETVALMMGNRPEYLAIWVGLTRVGCVVALLNSNLTGAVLAHSLRLVAPRHLIVEDGLVSAYRTALPHIETAPRPWIHGAAADGVAAQAADRIDLAVAALDGGPLGPGEARPPRLEDRALQIYTSGTTGLPKAANVSHRRIMTWSFWFAGLMRTGPEDRIYDCLPLYHSVGGVVATGALLAAGGSVVIAEKFSSRRFWDEVTRWDCTLFQYIGELCRYLLQMPPVPAETAHRLRLACGNGLRHDIWTAFQERFRIPRLLEFYAATEGNVSLVNVEGKVGSIGRIPAFLAHRFAAAIVKFDPDRGEPLRDRAGFCIRCAPDEPGEAIGLIGDGTGRPAGAFEGYTSAADSAAKVLRHVFAPEDAWFRTGDLMRVDAQGFYYFVDRVGDTFRWKGENVATSEVAAVLSGCAGVLEANVYGVGVPGTDGRAGMAALVAGPGFSLETLQAHLAAHLPAYARPAFLRLQAAIAVTDTFKHKKAPLAEQGFDPARIGDPLYVAQGPQGYVPLDAAMFARIVAGEVRL